MALIVLNNLTELYNMYQITIAFNLIILIIRQSILMKITYSNLIAKTSWHTYWKFRMKSKIFILVFEMKVWYYRSQARRYKHVTLFLIIKQYTLYLIKQKVHIAASLSILTSLFAKKLQNASTRITAYICGISTLTCEVMPASYNWF